MESPFHPEKPSAFLNKTIKIIILIVVILCILVFILYKWLKHKNDDTNPFTQRLLNYLIPKKFRKQNDYDDLEKNNNSSDIISNDEIDLDENDNNYDTFNLIPKLSSNSKTNIKNNEDINKENDNMSNKNSISNDESNDRVSISKFANDYCKKSPNIKLNMKKNIVNIGTRINIKFFYNVTYELLNSNTNKKDKTDSIMTLISLNTSLINIYDDNIRNYYLNYIKKLSSKYHNCLVQYLNIEILKKQKFLIKIIPFYSQGSLRDIIYNTNPLLSFRQKLSVQKGRILPMNKIINYSFQLIKIIYILHKNNFYHLNIHSGNILVNDDDSIQLDDIEFSINKLPMKNESFLKEYYIYFDNLLHKNKKSNNIKNESPINLFEMIDIVCFGKVFYEMLTGTTLKNRNINLKNLKFVKDQNAIDLLKYIFPNNGLCKVNAKDILNMKIFTNFYKQNILKNINKNYIINADYIDKELIKEYGEDFIVNKQNDDDNIIYDILFDENNFLKRKININGIVFKSYSFDSNEEDEEEIEGEESFKFDTSV